MYLQFTEAESSCKSEQTYTWTGQEDLHSLVFTEDAVSRDLPQERLQCPAVRLPLSQTHKTCRENNKHMRSSAVKGLILYCFHRGRGCLHSPSCFIALADAFTWGLAGRGGNFKKESDILLHCATKQIHKKLLNTLSL